MDLPSLSWGKPNDHPNLLTLGRVICWLWFFGVLQALGNLCSSDVSWIRERVPILAAHPGNHRQRWLLQKLHLHLGKPGAQPPAYPKVPHGFTGCSNSNCIYIAGNRKSAGAFGASKQNSSVLLLWSAVLCLQTQAPHVGQSWTLGLRRGFLQGHFGQESHRTLSTMPVICRVTAQCPRASLWHCSQYLDTPTVDSWKPSHHIRAACCSKGLKYHIRKASMKLPLFK